MRVNGLLYVQRWTSGVRHFVWVLGSVVTLFFTEKEVTGSVPFSTVRFSPVDYCSMLFTDFFGISGLGKTYSPQDPGFRVQTRLRIDFTRYKDSLFTYKHCFRFLLPWIKLYHKLQTFLRFLILHFKNLFHN